MIEIRSFEDLKRVSAECSVQHSEHGGLEPTFQVWGVDPEAVERFAHEAIDHLPELINRDNDPRKAMVALFLTAFELGFHSARRGE